MTHSNPSIATVPIIILATTLAGCNGNSSSAQNGAQATPSSTASAQIPQPAPTDVDAQNSALLAAAEPFENLTESAYTGDTKKLDSLIAKAKSSAAAAKPYLPADQAKALADHVSAIDVARSGNDRADLAIAAVEGYRTLVSNVVGNQKIPKQVSLLDYVGFRYQADLKATPIRWGDSSAALDFADAQWQQISGTVADQNLRSKMSAALANMRSATKSKNVQAAMTASTHESDLVDSLEHYFAALHHQ